MPTSPEGARHLEDQRREREERRNRGSLASSRPQSLSNSERAELSKPLPSPFAGLSAEELVRKRDELRLTLDNWAGREREAEEETRRWEEQRAERVRLAEENRRQWEAEDARLAEEERLAEEARRAEAERQKIADEERRQAEERERRELEERLGPNRCEWLQKKASSGGEVIHRVGEELADDMDAYLRLVRPRYTDPHAVPYRDNPPRAVGRLRLQYQEPLRIEPEVCPWRLVAPTFDEQQAVWDLATIEAELRDRETAARVEAAVAERKRCGLCPLCGRSLDLFSRLRKRDRHPACKEFRE